MGKEEVINVKVKDIGDILEELGKIRSVSLTLVTKSTSLIRKIQRIDE